MSNLNIIPYPGYILTIPYIPKKVFQPTKDPSGIDQLAEVIAVGPDLKDDNGEMRTTPAKVGDIIIHVYNNSELDLDSQKYRFVHFTQVHGEYKIDATN